MIFLALKSIIPTVKYCCTESLQTSFLSSHIKYVFCNFLQIAFESVSNIRTVVALGLEDNFSSKYNDSLYEPYR